MITDLEAMLQAVKVGEQARIIAPPNPWVGCLIVKNGEIVGEGFTQSVGGPHAEINALRMAGPKAQNATVYVTLEPCSHYGRTPPCTEALIEAQVARVVIGQKDPDLHVNGEGIKNLLAAGIKVDVGLCPNETYASLEPYLHHRKTGRPFCIAKGAISIDGRIAASDGSSRWITSSKAQTHTHQLRLESQAIIIGSGTALADRPTLTVRNVSHPLLQQPLRVILDARGQVEPIGPLFDVSFAPTLIFTTKKASQSRIDDWQRAQVQVEIIKENTSGSGVDLETVMTSLGKRNILQVLVEGGALLLGNLLKAKLMDQLFLYVGPCILGTQGKPLIDWIGPATINEAPRLNLKKVITLDDSVCLN